MFGAPEKTLNYQQNKNEGKELSCFDDNFLWFEEF
jgi:hypothetical protein